MTKIISGKSHGTRASYVAGCRCKKCCMANSAYEYARRKVAGWDRPLGASLVATESVALDGGRLAVPVEVLREAVFNLSREIKIEALSVLWRINRKGEVK